MVIVMLTLLMIPAAEFFSRLLLVFLTAARSALSGGVAGAERREPAVRLRGVCLGLIALAGDDHAQCGGSWSTQIETGRVPRP